MTSTYLPLYLTFYLSIYLFTYLLNPTRPYFLPACPRRRVGHILSRYGLSNSHLLYSHPHAPAPASFSSSASASAIKNEDIPGSNLAILGGDAHAILRDRLLPSSVSRWVGLLAAHCGAFADSFFHSLIVAIPVLSYLFEFRYYVLFFLFSLLFDTMFVFPLFFAN